MLPRHLRGLLRRVFVVAAMIFLSAADFACAGPALFSENWESYTNGVTPYGRWKLEKGAWADISDGGGLGGGKYYFVGANVQSRLRHPVDLSGCKDIVLQGWLYDSGSKADVNRSILGLTGETNANTAENPWIRMGVGAAGKFRTYRIVYYDYLQSDRSIVVDSELPSEKGWHFMRLEIMHDRTVNYQIWNAAKTIEKKGQFGWVFDKSKFTYVMLGSGVATPGKVGWDDIKVGSLEEIGPAPRLPSRAE